MRGTRNIDIQARLALKAYRAWRSPKTAAKRAADADRRRKQQELNIKAKAKVG